MFSESAFLTSVILVTYQTGSVLFRAIDAALAQTMPVELIIVDNGNPEDVVAELRARAADSRIKLITGHGNIGFARANNLGVAASRGDYILILNPDCILQPDAVAKLLAHADHLPHPFLVGPRIVNSDGSDQRGCRRALLTPASAFVEALHLQKFLPNLRLNLHETPLPTALTPVPAISGAAMFLSRRDYDLIGGFDEAYFLHVEDLDFCLRFRRQGGEIYFAPDTLVTHIGGTSEAPSATIERHKRRSFSLYFHRNFGKTYPLPLLWLLDIAIWMRYLLRRLLIIIQKK